MPTRAIVRLGLAGLAALAVAGCGGASGLAAKSPKQIIAAMNKAVARVQSVHVAGSIHSGASVLGLDLTLAANGAEGSISQDALHLRVIRSGSSLFLRGDAAFLRHFAGPSGERLLGGKWLKTPISGQFSSLASLTTIRPLFQQLLSSHDALAKGATTKIDGQKVIALRDTTQNGTLYVATSGEPYPVAIVKRAPQSGRVDFSGYNRHVRITAPPGAIDLTKLG